MRRRVIVSSILAVSAFGLTTGLTASMNVGAADLGAATSTVSACDADGIDLSYGLVTGDISSLDTISLAGIDAACDTQSVLVELVGAGGVVLAQLTGTADATGSLDLPLTTPIAAADLLQVNTVITG